MNEEILDGIDKLIFIAAGIVIAVISAIGFMFYKYFSGC